ncbi:MAG: tetratricopeptide repeat protein, partial [Patescibacteria group bacterium]
MKSRLSVTASNLGQSLTSLKELPKKVRERRAERAEVARESGAQVRPPRSSWRQQLSTVSEGLSGRVKQLRQAVAGRLQGLRRERPAAPVPAPAAGAPRLTLRRIEDPRETAAPRIETTAEKLQAFVRKQRATTSPVEEAQAAKTGGNFDRAEDILLPYIAKHPKNPMAYMVLGEIAVSRGNWDEAVESFEQVIRLDQAAPGAFAKLGE